MLLDRSLWTSTNEVIGDSRKTKELNAWINACLPCIFGITLLQVIKKASPFAYTILSILFIFGSVIFGRHHKPRTRKDARALSRREQILDFNELACQHFNPGCYWQAFKLLFVSGTFCPVFLMPRSFPFKTIWHFIRLMEKITFHIPIWTLNTFFSLPAHIYVSKRLFVVQCLCATVQLQNVL